VELWRMELSNWTIFSLLDKEFAAQIRLACVFGTFSFFCVLRGLFIGLENKSLLPHPEIIFVFLS
jgi:hypothetical protein